MTQMFDPDLIQAAEAAEPEVVEENDEQPDDDIHVIPKYDDDMPELIPREDPFSDAFGAGRMDTDMGYTETNAAVPDDTNSEKGDPKPTTQLEYNH